MSRSPEASPLSPTATRNCKPQTESLPHFSKWISDTSAERFGKQKRGITSSLRSQENTNDFSGNLGSGCSYLLPQSDGSSRSAMRSQKLQKKYSGLRPSKQPNVTASLRRSGFALKERPTNISSHRTHEILLRMWTDDARRPAILQFLRTKLRS